MSINQHAIINRNSLDYRTIPGERRRTPIRGGSGGGGSFKRGSYKIDTDIRKIFTLIIFKYLMLEIR